MEDKNGRSRSLVSVLDKSVRCAMWLDRTAQRNRQTPGNGLMNGLAMSGGSFERETRS